MNDFQIRKALKCDLIEAFRYDRDSVLLEELGLRHGTARVDLAVINGKIHGFELKSDSDTLRRLTHQVIVYNSVFDRVTLVVGRRHISEVVRMVPEWWGIKLAKVGENGAISFSEIRKPSDNPSPESLAVVKLLWRDEALSLLEEFGAADDFRHKPRAAIYARLAEVADLRLLYARVRRQLKTRTNWRVAVRQMLYDG